LLKSFLKLTMDTQGIHILDLLSSVCVWGDDFILTIFARNTYHNIRNDLDELTAKALLDNVPVYAGEYTIAECAGRDKYIIDGKEYDECSFCRASCPSRDAFKEPDSGLPLKCDMCESDPPLEKPMCVQWCLNEALIYEEREEEVDEEVSQEELEVGLESLANKYGFNNIMDVVARMSESKKD